MFSIGEESYLRVWNTEKHVMAKERVLSMQPTSITVHPLSVNISMIGYHTRDIFYKTPRLKNMIEFHNARTD